MSKLDYSDQVVITITKVKFDGKPSHWGVIIEQDSEEIGSGTAPSFAGVFDMAYEMIAGGDKGSDYERNPWAEFDANYGENK